MKVKSFLQLGVRDLLWAMLVVGLAVGWCGDRRYKEDCLRLERVHEKVLRDFEAAVEKETETQLKLEATIRKAKRISRVFLRVLRLHPEARDTLQHSNLTTDEMLNWD